MNWTVTLVEPKKLEFSNQSNLVYLDLRDANKFKMEKLEGSFENGVRYEFLKNTSVISYIEIDFKGSIITFFNPTGFTVFPNSVLMDEGLRILFQVGRVVAGLKGGRSKRKSRF